jgi:hypothetical protein
MKKKKEQTQEITAMFSEATRMDKMQIDKDGTIHVFFRGEEIKIISSSSAEYYDRDSGKKKYLRKTDTVIPKIMPVSDTVFVDNDFVCAVDTNTKTKDGQKISVCSILGYKKTSTSIPIEIENTFALTVPFENVEKAENYGWYLALKKIEELYPTLCRKMKIALVVDADLGEHPAYNCREKPFFVNVYLPENVQLVYASSDVGKDEILNKLMQTVDKMSNTFFEKFYSVDKKGRVFLEKKLANKK